MSADERFDALYEECYAPVYRYVLRRVASAAVDDVVSEVFLTAWRRRREVPGEALPWLYGVARRVIGNHLRAARRSDHLVEALGQSLAPQDELSVVDTLHASWALSQLSVKDKEMLLLIAWEGLTVREASRALGITAATCSVRLHRARRRFERFLASDGSHERVPEASYETR
jgi:RNA polymerase sigma-70 factor (ECF subfamily)